MDFKRYSKGIINLEVKVLYPEKFINLLWRNGILAKNIQKLDISTITIEVELKNYNEVLDLAKKSKARIKVIGRKGIAFTLLRMKKKSTLIAGSVLFLAMLYYLSTYIWSIQVDTSRYVSPYEIRQQLGRLGIKPGVKKSLVDFRQLEKKLEDGNGEIMWVRARIEGSTLKVKIEEKINPPEIVKQANENDVVAKMDGEVVRVYTTSGTAAVNQRDLVKKGQVLIKGVQGKEGAEYKVEAAGKVFANTFYEKITDLQISGNVEEQTGNKQEAVYLEILGKKIYIKKPTKEFANYDKIENKGKIFNKIVYYEKSVKPIGDTKENIINNATNKLYDAIMKDIDKQGKFVKKMVNTEDIGEGKVRLKVAVVIEQNIAIKP
ncbi:sporulation protein YqfD [Clostridium sp. C8-1-8]|uniref:sporulation protein YqfD n=1 Tax=Clostridium sp. C8-1-8 TaxID=2698831 RepID=UPI00136D0031|nr:sporulation protein YqfD [Clostridium sp. C8-1-8]